MVNTLVVLQWYRMAVEAAGRSAVPTETDAFNAVCGQHFASSPGANCSDFHAAALRSEDAVLHMRYCAAYDPSLENLYMPTNNWLRDDRLGGLMQLQDLSYGTGHVFR